MSGGLCSEIVRFPRLLAERVRRSRQPPWNRGAPYRFPDEQNRLTEIRADNGTTVLARYRYDALGRRVTFEDPVAGTVTRYYYDGSRVIEERDAGDARLRYHVNP